MILRTVPVICKPDLQIKAVMQFVNAGCLEKGFEIVQEVSKLFCVSHSSLSLSFLADFTRFSSYVNI